MDSHKILQLFQQPIQHSFKFFQSNGTFLNKAVEVRNNLSVGRGLFAAESINKGERIFSFNGPYISREYASNFTLQIGKDIFLETAPNALYEDCINHACFGKTHKPNCKIEFNFSIPINQNLIGRQSEPGQVVLIALNTIEKGCQLFFDYATTEENMNDPQGGQVCSFNCKCGVECRGYISGFASLTKVQARILFPYMSPYIKSLARDKFGEMVSSHD